MAPCEYAEFNDYSCEQGAGYDIVSYGGEVQHDDAHSCRELCSYGPDADRCDCWTYMYGGNSKHSYYKLCLLLERNSEPEGDHTLSAGVMQSGVKNCLPPSAPPS